MTRFRRVLCRLILGVDLKELRTMLNDWRGFSATMTYRCGKAWKNSPPCSPPRSTRRD